jgi:hypothetical protein
MLVVFALVLMSSVSFAQLGNNLGVGTAWAEILVTVGGNLDVALAGGDWSDPPLAAGVTYTVEPINGFVTPDPIPGNNTAFEPITLTIGGDGFLDVAVTFTLPTYLLGEIAGNRIGISFGPQSAYWFEASQLINPNNTFNVNIGAGDCNIALGATLAVPANATADLYHGQVIALAQVSGL